MYIKPFRILLLAKLLNFYKCIYEKFKMEDDNVDFDPGNNKINFTPNFTMHLEKVRPIATHPPNNLIEIMVLPSITGNIINEPFGQMIYGVHVIQVHMVPKR